MDSNATIVLKPVGDVELWYVDAADCTWRLPVHVEWKRDDSNGNLYGLILPGTCFYEVQALAMHSLLGRYTLEDRNDRWLLPRRDVEALLRKAPGIHAEFYYDWPDKAHPPIPSSHGQSVMLRPRRLTESGSFAEFVSVHHNLPADVVNVVLSAIAGAGATWLVRYRRTIDLGFVRLIAVPLRANWKEIVMFKGKSRGLLNILLMSKRERTQRLAAIHFPATLCSPHNISLAGGRIDYSVEAMATNVFENTVEQVNEERMGAGEYVAWHAKVIEHLYEPIVDCLARYARKTQAAWASVCKGRDGCGPAIVPSKPGSYRGLSLEDLPVDIVPTGSDFSVFAEGEGADQRSPLPAASPEMPALPAVPPAANDVRKRGRPGSKSAGVLLLDASQGTDAGQSMLPCGSTAGGNPRRMDGG